MEIAVRKFHDCIDLIFLGDVLTELLFNQILGSVHHPVISYEIKKTIERDSTQHLATARSSPTLSNEFVTELF